ncbi:MAG: GTPase Era [Lysobacterales bacterium]
MIDQASDSRFRFGYVAIVGRPNVGKSTLMNRILGQKISIVTAKPQTTRQQIMGIKTTGAGQVVYLDTPGIHRSSGRALNRYMNRVAKAAFRDVDLVLFMIEAGRWSRNDQAILKTLRAANLPILLVINKVDLLKKRGELLSFVAENVVPQELEEVMMICATRGDGVDDLEARVMDKLPFSRPFYDEDQITDRSERFLAAELVREALTERLHQELPYALTVEIEQFKREGSLLNIGAVIWVERDSQKQIVIGKGGRALKQIGSQARRAMEELFEQKVFLQTWVKVSKDWTRSQKALERFGYGES